ncbi:hypothetical protein [Methanorbis furvi]|uniref:Uncharacterized protein n=1 Tax=Methanorbis furvi TaxID=3028299 RepID=A0AAE4MCG5_9EURY|nr:hypothetical protein [Methanocorpusculaceae archaeon Ag1]
MGWIKTLLLLIVAFGVCVLLIGAFTGAGGSDNPIAGNWYDVEEGTGYCNLEFYENGLGTAYVHYDKGVLSASDYGLSGYLKTTTFDFQYTKIGEKVYSAKCVSVYAESYTGQNTYISKSEFPGLDMGTFEIKQAGKYQRNLIWTLGDDEPDILKRGTYAP